MLIKHLFLTKESKPDKACLRVKNFLENTQLVQYDHIAMNMDQCINGESTQFWHEIEYAISANQAEISSLITEICTSLQISKITDLVSIGRGYESKLVHILAHFLDGFITIDSAFYNLEEDSHTLSLSLKDAIQKEPSLFWLVYATGSISTPEKADQLNKVRSSTTVHREAKKRANSPAGKRSAANLKAILNNCLFARSLRHTQNFILRISTICLR